MGRGLACFLGCVVSNIAEHWDRWNNKAPGGVETCDLVEDGAARRAFEVGGG